MGHNETKEWDERMKGTNERTKERAKGKGVEEVHQEIQMTKQIVRYNINICTYLFYLERETTEQHLRERHETANSTEMSTYFFVQYLMIECLCE